MRVLVLAPTMGSAGGIQRYTETLVRALKELEGPPNVAELAVPDRPGRSAESRLPAGLKLRFLREALAKGTSFQPDLIICTHLGLAPLGWVLGRLRRRPYWVVVHGIEAWCRLPLAKQSALRHADRVVATSAFNREQVLRQQHLNSERMVRLPCALDKSLLKLEAREVAPCRFVPAGRRAILSVARLAASERYKGHEVVLRALPAVVTGFPNLTYLIVGDGDDRPRLEALTGELKLTDYVVFAGRVTDAELAACCRTSEVFVLPARTVLDDRAPKGEGFGIVYLEAMALGLPVIGPDYGAPPEIIRHGEHGLLVNAEDPQAIARALVELLSSPERARQMGEAARLWVRREFSYEAFRDRLRQLLAGTAAWN